MLATPVAKLVIGAATVRYARNQVLVLETEAVDAMETATTESRTTRMEKKKPWTFFLATDSCKKK
jgi:hypothetical protein